MRHGLHLDQSGVVRATVESVAESTVDGVAAPLFYALSPGRSGRWSIGRSIRWTRCSAIATSVMPASAGRPPVGQLGRFSPRAADGAVAVPAAALLRQRPLQAVRVLFRDGRKHASPNAGLPEAAMAGALGAQSADRSATTACRWSGHVRLPACLAGPTTHPAGQRHDVDLGGDVPGRGAVAPPGSAHLWHPWRDGGMKKQPIVPGW